MPFLESAASIFVLIHLKTASASATVATILELSYLG